MDLLARGHIANDDVGTDTTNRARIVLRSGKRYFSATVGNGVLRNDLHDMLERDRSRRPPWRTSATRRLQTRQITPHRQGSISNALGGMGTRPKAVTAPPSTAAVDRDG